MTKAEFLEQIKNYPSNACIVFLHNDNALKSSSQEYFNIYDIFYSEEHNQIIIL